MVEHWDPVPVSSLLLVRRSYSPAGFPFGFECAGIQQARFAARTHCPTPCGPVTSGNSKLRPPGPMLRPFADGARPRQVSRVRSVRGPIRRELLRNRDSASEPSQKTLLLCRTALTCDGFPQFHKPRWHCWDPIEAPVRTLSVSPLSPPDANWFAANAPAAFDPAGNGYLPGLGRARVPSGIQ